jgi:hypothetical protein
LLLAESGWEFLLEFRFDYWCGCVTQCPTWGYEKCDFILWVRLRSRLLLHVLELIKANALRNWLDSDRFISVWSGDTLPSTFHWLDNVSVKEQIRVLMRGT